MAKDNTMPVLNLLGKMKNQSNRVNVKFLQTTAETIFFVVCQEQCTQKAAFSISSYYCLATQNILHAISTFCKEILEGCRHFIKAPSENVSRWKERRMRSE